MKKLIGILILFLMLSTASNALTMKDIDEVEITIEKNNIGKPTVVLCQTGY